MNEKLNLLDLSIVEIQKTVEDMGQEKFRGKQIFSWIHKGISEFDEMTDISIKLRNELSKITYIGKLKIVEKLISKEDGTRKYLFALNDENIIESVLMEYEHGLTACISTQAGCKMGCSFCASTGLDFNRNLTPGEMLDQILQMQKDIGKRIGNIVLMGIGEPFDNYENVLKFLRIVNSEDGLNIGYRHISISTCGLIKKINEFANEKIPVTLSVSLHAPNDEIRSALMPVNKSNSIDKVIKECQTYTEITKRRITFEYALIEGVNDSRENARELAERIKGMLVHVNLIPINTIKTADFKRSEKSKIETFKKVLTEYEIETTVRRELGSDIEAACGQLRKSRTKIGQT